MSDIASDHTVGQDPDTLHYSGLPALSHIDYCFLCCYTLRGTENCNNLGEVTFSGP